MIGVTHAALRTAIFNDPVTPVFTSPAHMASINGPAGSGTFTFQFNATKRTCNTTTTGSVLGTGSSSFQYFSANALVDPLDYEVMVTLGTNVDFSNIAAAGGSATLGVWHTLANSPLFVFNCSGRRGGSRPVNVTVRHRVNTGVSASTSITLNQSSDAAHPVLTGDVTTTSIVRTTTNSYLGVYIDNTTAANLGRLYTFKGTTLFSSTSWGFSTGSIPESEYEISSDFLSISPSGALTPTVTGPTTFIDIATLRLQPQAWNNSVGRFLSVLGTNPAATGKLRITVRHKLDRTKSSFADYNFATG